MEDLRDDDSRHYLALKTAYDQTGSALYLSTIVRHIQDKEPDYDQGSDCLSECDTESIQKEPVYEFARTLDLASTQVCRRFAGSPEDLIQSEYFADYGPEEDGIAHVLLVAPCRLRFLEAVATSEEHLAEDILSYLTTKDKQNLHDLSYRPDLLQLCTRIIEQKEAKLRAGFVGKIRYSDPVVRVANICIRLGSLTCFNEPWDVSRRALHLSFSKTYTSFWLPLISKELLSGMLWFAPLMPKTDALSLDICADAFQSFEPRFQALKRLFGTDLDNLITRIDAYLSPLGQWFLSKMEDLLEPTKILVKSARRPLIYICELAGWEYLLDK